MSETWLERAIDHAERRPRLVSGALAVAMLVTAVLVLRITRGTSFYYDEWNFLLNRRGVSTDSLLKPHNEHLSLIPILIYKTYLKIFGPEHYLPFRLTVLGLHLVSAALLFEFARRRVPLLIALAAGVSLLLLGSAWQNILWPFQISYLLSIASGLGALLALDRPARAGNALAAILLGVSLASSGVGLIFVLAIAVRVLWRDERRQALVVVVGPLILYLIWYALYGHSQATRETVANAPKFAADMAAASFGGWFGLGSDWGRPLTVAAVALLVYVIGRSPRLLPALATVLVIPLAFWTLTAASRAGTAPAEASRYIYIGVLGAALVALQLERGVRLPALGLACLYAILAFAVLANLQQFRSGASFLRATATTTKAELAAMEIARPYVAPDFSPDSLNMPQVQAGPYFDFIDDFGSPADTVGELAGAPESARGAADKLLFRAEEIGFKAKASTRVHGAAPTVSSATSAKTTVAGSCVRFKPSPRAEGTVTIVARSPGVVLSSIEAGPIDLKFRRFAGVFDGAPQLTVRGPAKGTIALPRDSDPSHPWNLQITSTAPLRACAAG